MSLYDSINDKIKEKSTKDNKAFIRNQKRMSILRTILYGLLIASDMIYLAKEYYIGIVPMTLYIMGGAIALEIISLIATIIAGMGKGNGFLRGLTIFSIAAPLAGYVPLMAYGDATSIILFAVRIFVTMGIGYILFTKKPSRDKKVRKVQRLTLYGSAIGLLAATVLISTTGNERRVVYAKDHTLDGYVVKEVFMGKAPVSLKSNTVMIADEALKNVGEELTLPDSLVYISENAFFESNVKILHVSSSNIKMMDAIDNSKVEIIYLEEKNTVIDMENSSSNQVEFIASRDDIDDYRSQYRSYDYMFVPKVNEDEMYIVFNGTELPVIITTKDDIYSIGNPYDEELTVKYDDNGNEYLFQGWYNGDEELNFPFDVDGDTAVTAVWSRVYNVTLIADGGVSLEGDEIDDDIRYHSELGTYTLPDLFKANYRFDGWYDVNDSKTKITEINESISSDLNLKARFLKLYTITYELNGGSFDDSVVEYTIEDNITLESAARSGYAFLGWYDEEGNKITSLGNGSGSDIKLYAQYELNPVTITLSESIDRDYDATKSEVSVTATHELSDAVLSYAWYRKNSSIVVATASSFDVENFSDSGVYYCKITATLDDYEAVVTTDEVTVDIHKLTYDMSEVSFKDAELTYTGTAQRPSVTGTLPSGIDGLQVNVSYIGSATNVSDGKQEVTAVFSTISENYKSPEPMKASVTIVPMEVTVVWDNDSLLFLYDGEIHVAKATVEGVLDGDSATVTVTGGTNSIGTHTAKAEKISNDNYTLGANTTQEYEILKGDFKISDYVSTKDCEYTYDGLEHYPQLTGKLPAGVTPSYSESITNVGSKLITISFSYDDTSYDIYETLSATVSIVPKEIEVSLSYSETTYNGTIQHPVVTITNLVEGDECTPVIESDDSINAGSYTLKLNGLSNENYKLAKVSSFDYTILKANYDMSGVSFSDLTKVYDSNTYTPVLEGTLPTGLDNIPVTAQIEDGIKNVGTKAVTVTFAGSSNYNTPDAMSANITITQREVAITLSSNSFVYNGLEQKPTLEISNLVSSDSCSLNTSASTSINAGSYTITVNSLGNSNYKMPEEKAYTYTIAKANYDMSGVSFLNVSYTYDGNTHKPALSGVLPTGADSTQLSASVGDGIKNVGSTLVTVTFTGSNNYNTPDAMTATVTITPKTIGLSWGETTHEYTGTSWVPTATAVGLIGSDECIVSVSGANVNAGSYIATANQLSNENYKLPQNASKSFVITKASFDILPSINTDSVTYDGQKHAPIVTNIDANIIVEYSIDEMIDAATYTVTITYAYENDNYEITREDEVEFTILKKEITLSWEYDSIVYDKNENCPGANASGLISGDECYVIVEDSRNVDAGKYIAEAVELTNSNYKLPEDATHSYTIEKAEYDMSGVTFENVSYTYDGNSHKPALSGTLPTGIDDTQVTATISEGLATVGTKTVIASFNGSPNYNTPASMSATVTITQKVVEIQWGTLTNTYTGSPWAPTASAVGLILGDSCTVAVSGANTNAGTYSATAYQLSNGNYKLNDSVSTSYTITKAKYEFVPSCTKSFEYDGLSHTPVISNLPVGAEAVFDSSIRNVGSKLIEVTYSYDNENYEITQVDKIEVTITRKVAVLEWSYSSIVYNGSSQTPTAVVSNLVSGDTCNVSLIETSFINVGSYQATAMELSNSNYVLGEVTHDYEITKATYDMSEITFRNTVVEYDGNSHIPTLTGTLPTGADGTVVTVSYDKNATNVSSVTVTASFVGSENYNAIASMSATITINPKAIGLSWGTLSHVYDEKSWAPSATATDLILGDSCTVSVSGANTNAGTYTAKAISLSNTNYKLPTNVTVTYSITKAELKFTPVFTTSFEYDGIAHTPVATSLPVGVTPSYNTSLTNVGSTDVIVSYSYTSDNYKIDSTTELTLTITAKEITITQSFTEAKYTGDTLAPELLAEGLITGDICTISVSSASNKNVGSYSVSATGLSNTNYKLPEVKTFAYSIIKADYDMSGVSFKDSSITYDGISHGISVTGSLPIGEDDIQVSAVYSVASVKNAGSYDVTVSFTTASANYNTPAQMSAVITVTQAPVTINWDQSTLVFTYDGNTHIPSATVTGVLGLDVCNVTITGESNVAGSHTATAEISNSNYYIEVGSQQSYAITSGSFNVIELVTFTDTVKEYNGEEQYPTLTGTLPSYVVVQYSSGRTAVGETVVTATFSSNDSNYTVSGTLEAKITITPKTLAVSWSNASFTYDGYSHCPVPTLTGYLGSDTSSYTVSDGMVNAGSHTATISALTNTNYQLPSNSSCAYTIAKASYDMSGISFTNITVEYDGNSHTPVISGTLPVGKDSIQLMVEYSSGLTNAGSLEVTASFTTASENYNTPASIKAVVTVEKLVVGISWSELEFTYNGSVHIPKATVTGTILGDTVTATVIGAAVDAGSYTAEVTAINNSNYALPSSCTKNYVIQKATYDMSGVEFNNVNAEYDGLYHTPVIQGTLPEGVSVSYTDGLTHAGEKTVTASFTGSSNYNAILDMTATVTVTRKLITLEWENTLFTYDGDIHTPSYTLSGVVEGDVVNVTFTGGSSEVGPHTASITGLVNTDYYLDSSSSQDYEIIKGSYDMSGITFSDASYTYDGQSHSIAIGGTLPTGGDGIQVKVSYTGSATHVADGKVKVTATFTSTSENYNVPDVMTAYVSISKKVVGVSWTGINTTYDGELHLPAATATGLVGSDTCTLTVTGAKTVAGTHTATLTEISNEDYALPTEVTKSFTIGKAEYDLSNITFTDAQLTYNGEAQHQTIQGTFIEGVDGSSPAVAGYTGSATNVKDGEVIITVSFTSGSENYNAPQDMTARLSITPAILEIEWGIDSKTKESKSTYSLTYDTFEHAISLSVLSGLINDDTCTVSASDTFKDVGSYLVSFEFSNENYTAVTTQISITVSKLYIYYINFWTYKYIGLYKDDTITGGENVDVVTVFEDMKYTYYEYDTDEYVGDTIPVRPGTYYTILVSNNTNVSINCGVQSDSFKVTISAAFIDAEIKALPNAADVTISDIADIRTLKSDYNSLTQNEKAQVSDITKLNDLLSVLDYEMYWTSSSNTGISNSVFQVTTGKTSNMYGSISYAGLSLSWCLKMETATSITFSTSETKTLTLVLGNYGNNNIKVDGTTYTGDSDRVVTVTVEAGTHTITRASSAYLYYMILM